MLFNVHYMSQMFCNDDTILIRRRVTCRVYFVLFDIYVFFVIDIKYISISLNRGWGNCATLSPQLLHFLQNMVKLKKRSNKIIPIKMTVETLDH